MLVVGLTGGIASGKSTAARELAALGAQVIDADVLARQVLEPGTPGLAAVTAQFGAVLLPDGSLDRAALAAVVFDDEDARRALEAIVHPAVASAFEARVAAAASSAVVIHDVPLLVENGLAPRYHLVLVTEAPEPERIRRAMAERGMTREAVAARIAVQASDAERRAVADVVLDGGTGIEELRTRLTRLWHERLVPYEANVRHGRRAARPVAALVSDPAQDPWRQQAERALARIRRAGGGLVLDAAHIGSTAVPGLLAKDVLDLQLGVARLEDAATLAPRLAAAGFPLVQAEANDTPKPDIPDPAAWRKTFHASADPGRPVNLHVRVTGSPGWRWALAFRDWLRADALARDRYAEVKEGVLRASAAELSADAPTWAYAVGKEPWFTAVDGELTAWVHRSGWQPRP